MSYDHETGGGSRWIHRIGGKWGGGIADGPMGGELLDPAERLTMTRDTRAG